jgi:hypothetical protein
MAVKRVVGIVVSLLGLVTILGTCLDAISPGASAVELSGTSPPIAPGTSWSKWIGWFDPGDIIEWSWYTADSALEFDLQHIVNGEIRHWWDLADNDGILVDSAGDYHLSWYNTGFFSPTVTYAAFGFTPSLTIAAPDSGAYLRQSSASVQGEFDGYADGVLVGLDAQHLHDATTVGTDWGIDTLGLNTGLNTILVRAYYLFGYYSFQNYSINRVVQVTVDTAMPELEVVAPHAGDYVRGTVEVSWICSDNTGIAKREVQVDASSWVEVANNTYATELADGSRTIRVRVADLAGNSVLAEITVISDTVAPLVTILGPDMNSRIDKDHIFVSWSGSDASSGIDHYEVQITGGQWVDVGAARSHEFTNLEDVWYNVTVKAIDKSGNNATSTVGFVIESQNGLLHAILLYSIVAAIMFGAIVAVLLLRRR